MRSIGVDLLKTGPSKNRQKLKKRKGSPLRIMIFDIFGQLGSHLYRHFGPEIKKKSGILVFRQNRLFGPHEIKFPSTRKNPLVDLTLAESGPRRMKYVIDFVAARFSN